MPTPFMHLALVKTLSTDPDLPADVRAGLQAGWGAFLLGSIAPDARVSGGLLRASTHFFEYDRHIETPPARAMLQAFPVLRRPFVSDPAQAAFIAGYAGHLAMDEIWCVEMLFPHFHSGWGTGYQRHELLHMLLAHLDDRDRAVLPASYYEALCGATPTGWLPFIEDSALIEWRDMVGAQLAPNAPSRTFEILGKRINMDEEQVRAYLNNEDAMRPLWENVPPEAVAAVEKRMYRHVRQTVIGYFSDCL
jgi:hypothetical protein